MEFAAYQPTLGKIQEEPDDPEELSEFDESILLEYAILTEDDLTKASYINDGDNKLGCTCGDTKNEWCSFSAFHKKTGVNNTQLIELSLNKEGIKYSPINGRKEEEHNGNLSECSDMNSGSSTSIVNIICEDHGHCVRVLSDYDYDSTYNSLNGNDSGIHNIDSRNNSICSDVSHNKSFKGSINESISKSLNNSFNESLFNIDDLVNISLNVPLEKQGIDFNTVHGRKVFIKAIRQKYMNIYYVVSQQRLSGDFIGNQSVATFVMVLNSLEIRQSELQGAYFQTHSLNDEMSFTDIASVARDNKLSAEVSQVFKESCISNFRLVNFFFLDFKCIYL